MVIVASLLCLAAANVRARWTWSEMEDGVLWTLTANECRGEGNRRRITAQRHGVRHRRRPGGNERPRSRFGPRPFDALHAAKAGEQLTYSILRDDRRELRHVTLAPVPSGLAGALLHARGRWNLLAARRRRCPAPASRQSGHAALLLADGRVLRRAVTSRSPAGSIALDWVFYWGDVVAHAAAAAAVPAFRADVPRAPGQLGAERRRAHAAAAAVLAGGAARRRSVWPCSCAADREVLSPA